MDHGFDKPRPEQKKPEMPQIASALFQAVGAQGPDTAIKGIQLAKSLLEEDHPDLPKEDKPVLGLTLLSNFSVTDEQRESLLEMIKDARKDPKSVTSRVLQRAQTIHRGVDTYFRTETTPFDVIQIAAIPDPVAMSVLTLEVHKVAAEANKKLKTDQKNGLVTAFINPESGEPGLWMSIEGIPFDASKLRKSGNSS